MVAVARTPRVLYLQITWVAHFQLSLVPILIAVPLKINQRWRTIQYGSSLGGGGGVGRGGGGVIVQLNK